MSIKSWFCGSEKTEQWELIIDDPNGLTVRYIISGEWSYGTEGIEFKTSDGKQHYFQGTWHCKEL